MQDGSVLPGKISKWQQFKKHIDPLSSLAALWLLLSVVCMSYGFEVLIPFVFLLLFLPTVVINKIIKTDITQENIKLLVQWCVVFVILLLLWACYMYTKTFVF